ncbi:arsenate reductase [Penicillium crustosum]|uniref:arsenate reductase n=1 Tax=Penicillium crustosum TaxID=36656 RepID=UPI0023893CC7|nr:arsenate reductase [Penicillium crustosum]KAJ5409965.1 arsenate reductase [Penicillium crustosum]
MASEAGVAHISAGELHNRFLEGEEPGRHFILVDLRASDFKGGTIKGSLNIPMESLPSAIPTLYHLSSSTEISDVIFFCGSSCGRGPKGAALFSDYAAYQSIFSASKGSQKNPRGFVLTGGINGWAEGEKEYRDLMDGYDSEHWTSC